MRRVLAAAAVVLLSVTATPAFARTTVPVDPDRKVESTALRADETTGRAWVEVTVARRFSSGKEARARGAVIAVAVPELAFDPATKEITLGSGARRVTCGSGERVAPSCGRCTIDARIEGVVIDAGFGARTVERLVVDVLPR